MVLVAAILGVATAAAGVVPTEGSFDKRAMRAVELSRTTKATYALYSWNEVFSEDGKPEGVFSSEFHKGSLHRVETEVARVVADCAARTGAALFVKTGQIERSEQAAMVACGVSADAAVISAEYLGSTSTRFGKLAKIRLTNADNVREYEISPDGILVAAAIIDRAGKLEVRNSPQQIDYALPEEDIFSEESLHRIVTPEKYRAKR